MPTAVSPRNLHPPRRPDSEDDETRFYNNVAFGSDSYVPWVIGKLRLGKADLGRMRSAGVPVLRAHSGDSVVGRVVRVEKSEGVWRSNWELPKIGANEVTFQQLDSGILRGVSVGGMLLWDTLKIDNPDEANSDDVLWTCDWALVEESLTPIPADINAGIDRAIGDLHRVPQIFDVLISESGVTTPDTPELRQRLQTLVGEHNQNLTLRREQAMTTQTQIPPDVLQRAVADEMARNDALKRFTEVPDKLDQLITSQAEEEQRNMAYRAKLDALQYQPNGKVLQLSNWSPMDHALDLGKILRLTSSDDLGFPALDRSGSSLEESFLELQELEPAGRSTVARLPFAAIEERQRQLMLQRNTLAGGAGARPVDININGDGGLLLSAFSPIMGAMDVRAGLSGGQKLPYWTAQGSAAGGAEGADIPVSTWTLADAELLPISIATAFEISSSLRAADDMTFESLVYNSVQLVAGEELVKQVLDGAGSGSNEIAGLWGRVSTATPDQVHEYGAAPADCSRADILAVKNLVALAKTDGSPGSFILSTTMWQLCENILRGGAASDRYVLETMDGMGMMGSAMVGVMEGRPAYHFQDFAPSGIVNPGLYVKPDRVTIFLWGRSFNLELVPVLARKDSYKLCVEANMAVIQPDRNLSAIRQT